MEDGVTETYEDLVTSENDISKEEGEDQRSDAKASEDQKEQPSNGGAISKLISVLVSKNSEDQEEKGGGVKTLERKEEIEEKEGGIINHLISNLVSPSSPNARGDTYTASDQEEKVTGGMFNNLISGILHGGGEDHEKDEANQPAAAAGGGGGLIDNLVSHLPTPLSENVEAPATDEASILIHSIVHD